MLWPISTTSIRQIRAKGQHNLRSVNFDEQIDPTNPPCWEHGQHLVWLQLCQCICICQPVVALTPANGCYLCMDCGILGCWKSEAGERAAVVAWGLGCLTEMNTAGYWSRKRWGSEEHCLVYEFSWWLKAAQGSSWTQWKVLTVTLLFSRIIGLTSSRTTKSSLVTVFTNKTRPFFLLP